jgi:hypothetical protein
MTQCRALKVELAAGRELRHNGVEGVGKVGLLPRIGGGTGRPIVRSGHGHCCAGVDI